MNKQQILAAITEAEQDGDLADVEHYKGRLRELETMSTDLAIAVCLKGHVRAKQEGNLLMSSYLGMDEPICEIIKSRVITNEVLDYLRGSK